MNLGLLGISPCCPGSIAQVHSVSRKKVRVFAFIRNIGGPEILIVLVVVLLLFGAKKLPGLARSVGASAKEFKKGVDEGADESSSDSEDSSV